MLILGIDTSCDDTSASVVEDGTKIISNIVSSQDEVHKRFGGIVPELASRKHIEMIWPVVGEALKKAETGFNDISAIAVCYGPGLIGSLLVGVCFAKALAYVNKIPLVAVNHLEGHIFSSFLEEPIPEFPFIALVVSGGHTNIYRVDGFGMYTELGRTRDDAAGESFDKVAKLLELGYPGGPFIDTLSEKGDPETIPFPRPFINKGLDFSFSGLKTAVLTHIKKEPHSKKEDIAASFQSAVVDVIIEKTLKAAKTENINKIILSGGVSANRTLRKMIRERARKEKIKIYLLSPHLCTDNAAMIASAGFFYFKHGKVAGLDGKLFHNFPSKLPCNLDLNPKAYLPLGSKS